jgi:glycosyltransferase involved in cell wall biosynthesis
MIISNAFRPDPRALNEARGLSELGYRVTILAWDRATEKPQQEIIDESIHVIRIQSVRSSYGIGARQIWPLFRFWLAALAVISKLKPALLHCHDFDSLPVGILYSKLRRLPLIYDAREYYAELIRPRLTGITGRFLYKCIRFFESLGARIATAVITVDETLSDIYTQYNRKVVVIGHFPPRRMALQPSQAFRNARLTMVYAGRLSVDRGLLLYPEILRSLLNLGIPSRLLLMGVFTPEVGKRQLLERSVELAEHIEMINWVPYDAMTRTLQEADLGLSILMPEPRYVAAVPVKLFDYMAAGLPVIASNFPSVAKIVNETGCGILVDPLTSPEAIASQIATLWSEPVTAMQMGENGRQAILDRYNWEHLLERLAELYKSLLS